MLILFVILGFFLRLINLNQSLWLDEAISINFIQKLHLYEVIFEYAKADFHPPGYFIILWIWTHLFGFSEISARFPSVISGTFLICVTYLIGKELFNKKTGLICALFIAINPLLVYYSQEARMYSFAALTVALSFLLFIKFLKQEKVSLVLMIFANILVLLSDYLAYLIFPAQFIIILLFKKSILKRWLTLMFISLFFMIWWIPVFVEQLNVGLQAAQNIPGWKDVVGSGALKQIFITYIKFIIGRIDHPDNLIYLSLFAPVGIMSAFLFLKGIFSASKLSKILLLSWIIVPIGLGIVISNFVSVYSYFRVLFVVPAFIIVISAGMLSLKKKTSIILTLVFGGFEIIALLIYFINPIFHREDWKGAVVFLEANRNDGSGVYFESNGKFAPFEYYDKNNLKAYGALDKFPAESPVDISGLRNKLANITDVYLLNYLIDISDTNRLVEKELANMDYKLTNTYNFNGVGFIFKYQK